MSVKTIFFTGGGSGGHTLPALTLIKEIKSRQPSITISHLGRRQGIERHLLQVEVDNYYGIFTGKLRRHFSFKNVTDGFCFLVGLLQSIFILLPHSYQQWVLFSTGGFVSLGPVIASRLLGYTVYLHEQTSKVGLANKIASFFCHRVFISFESSRAFFPAKKVFYSGYPLRKEIESKKPPHFNFQGVALPKLSKPVLLVVGGGNGSLLLNSWVDTHRKELLDTFAVFHQVGRGFIRDYQEKARVSEGHTYQVFDFTSELIHLLQHAAVVVTRSGAGIVSELIYLNKPALFVPLKIAQRGEQQHNALEAREIIAAEIVMEEDLLKHSHLKTLFRLMQGKTSSTTKKGNTRINAREWLAKEISKC